MPALHLEAVAWCFEIYLAVILWVKQHYFCEQIQGIL